MEYVLVRYGEISLKGKNRSFFEKALVKNIISNLERNSVKYENVIRLRNRILIKTSEDCSCLKKVFGIVSFSPANKVELSLDEIKKEALTLFDKGTFKIFTKRIDSRVEWRSQKVNEVVGAEVVEKGGVVNLDNPETEIGIDLYNDYAFVFSEKILGSGGLPVGVEGVVTLILEDEKSLQAGILMMKRGCNLEIVNGKNISFEILKDYLNKIPVVEHPSSNSKAIVLGEELNEISRRDFELPIFRPLIGYKKIIV